MEKRKAPRVQGYAFTESDIQKFIDYYNSDKKHKKAKTTRKGKITWQDVGNFFGVDKDVIKNVVSQYTLGKRVGKIERNIERRAYILSEIAKGTKKAAIARALGISKHVLSMDLNRQSKIRDKK